MANPKHDKFVNPTNSQASVPIPELSQEVLLGDLAGTDQAEQIFEGVVDRHQGMVETPVTVTATPVAGPDLTGGDVDDDTYQAAVVGEEAVGGQTPTPDQNVTEELQRSMGISAADGEPVHTQETLTDRDRPSLGSSTLNLRRITQNIVDYGLPSAAIIPAIATV